MTEEERQELIEARGTGMAALICIQQLCRVMQEHKIMTTEQMRDAISEALAIAETADVNRPLDEKLNRATAAAIRAAFQD